jgi:hypothetical protein
MDLGGDHLDDMVARQRKVDLLEARRLRALAETACTVTIKPATCDSQPGLSADMSSGPASPLGPDHVNMDEMLEGFTDEVRICLRYHAGQFPSRKIDRAVFVGGESRHRCVFRPRWQTRSLGSRAPAKSRPWGLTFVSRSRVGRLRWGCA